MRCAKVNFQENHRQLYIICILLTIKVNSVRKVKTLANTKEFETANMFVSLQNQKKIRLVYGASRTSIIVQFTQNTYIKEVLSAALLKKDFIMEMWCNRMCV